MAKKKKTQTIPEGVELKKEYRQVWSKIKNTSRIPQAFYDVYGDIHILEKKGESKKIVTALKEVFIPVTQRSK